MAGPTLSASGYYNNGSNAWSTGTAALTVATAGDLLLVALEVDNAVLPTSVTDTQGNEYTLSETITFNGLSITGAKVFLYSATAASAGSNTVTVTFTSTEPAQFIYMDWVNGSLSSGNNSAGAATGGTATGSLTTAVANCVVVGWIFFGRPTGTTTFSMVPPGTVLESGGASPHFAMLTQYVAEATSGTTVTASGSESNSVGSTIVMFEVDPPAPTPPSSSPYSFSSARATSRLLLQALYSFATTISVSVSANPTSGSAPLDVSFTATPSGGVGPYTYGWTFGDGGTSVQQNPSYTYVNPGGYTAKVTVQDSLGHVASGSVLITVTASSTGGIGSPFPISRRVRFG